MTQRNKPGPGEARASGPTISDTLKADRCPAPEPLLENRYEFLGDLRFPAIRGGIQLMIGEAAPGEGR